MCIRDSYWINDESPKGYILEQVLRGSTAPPEFDKQRVSGRVIRYVDWVVPGVLAMNMMFSCLFGVGYVIVRYRKNGMLKRLKATPLTPLEFLSAQVASRWWLTLATTVLVFAGADFFKMCIRDRSQTARRPGQGQASGGAAGG